MTMSAITAAMTNATSTYRTNSAAEAAPAATANARRARAGPAVSAPCSASKLTIENVMNKGSLVTERCSCSQPKSGTKKMRRLSVWNSSNTAGTVAAMTDLFAVMRAVSQHANNRLSS